MYNWVIKVLGFNDEMILSFLFKCGDFLGVFLYILGFKIIVRKFR